MNPARASIRFYLDGELHTATGAVAGSTLLDYLRDSLGRTGTKEGCAEGDCGACTVVLAQVHGDAMRYRAVNACVQLLAAADGKELITVESLARRGESLHPVQQALVEHHASQCGFCTPGIVMSLFALYRSAAISTRPEVDEALSGNLCRCTGYRPIIDAALAVPGIGAALPQASRTRFSVPHGQERACPELEQEQAQIVARLRALRRGASVVFEGARDGGPLQSLHVPRDMDALLELTDRHPLATLLAGCTEVGVWLNKRQHDLVESIYLGEVADLHGVELRRDAIDIGAATPLTDVRQALALVLPELDELWRRFGSPPVRNVATLGGNLASASPVGDAAPALMALDARLVLRSRDGERRVSVSDFFTGYRRTVLRAGEVLTRIVIPRPDAPEFLRVYKVSRRFDQDIAVVSAGLRVVLDGRIIADARVCLGGVAPTPLRVASCEQALIGQVFSREVPQRALAALAKAIQPLDDHRSTARYRSLLAANLLRRFFIEGATDVATRVQDEPEPGP